jgi:hypothetical protein
MRTLLANANGVPVMEVLADDEDGSPYLHCFTHGHVPDRAQSLEDLINEDGAGHLNRDHPET